MDTGSGDFIGQVSDLIAQYSAEQHGLARRLDAFRRARTQLRLGRSPAVVLTLLEDELGERMDAVIGQRQAGPAVSRVDTVRASG